MFDRTIPFGVKLHGFLSYLVRCAVSDIPYTINGYKGKQVRDNLHSHDLIKMFWHFYKTQKLVKPIMLEEVGILIVHY